MILVPDLADIERNAVSDAERRVARLLREATGDPLPKLAPGDPADQIQSFELQLVDRLWESATPDNAREIADRTWDLVHDRGDADPVKLRVVECHQALAKMTRLGD